MTIFTIIRRNLRQRFARNLALIFSVALVAGLTTVFAAGRTFFATGDVLMDQPLIVVEPLYFYGAWLKESDTPKLKALAHFKDICRTQTYSGRNNEKNYSFPSFGADETYMTVFNKDGVWFPTTPDMVARYRADRTAFLVGELTAAKLGLQEGHQYTITTSAGPITGNCVGIARGGANKVNMVWHYEYVNDVLGNREGRITDWLIAVDDRKYVESTMAEIEEIFKTATVPISAGPAGDHVASKSSQNHSIVNLLGIVCALIFFVTMFITLNTVLFLVRERRQALAAMRAIGFRSGQVFRLVAMEVIVLCLIGGAVGIGFVLLVFHKGIPFGGGNLLVTIHLSALVAGTIVTGIIGIVSSVIPSWIASRVDILGALRST